MESLSKSVALTLYTSVCAGDGHLVFDESSRITVNLPPAFAFHLLGFQPPPVMGVSMVVGDSMEPMLHDGDLVLYDLTPDAGGGGVFVVNYEGQAGCKRVQPVGKGYRLIPENRLAGYTAELLRHTEEGYVQDETGDLVEFGIVGRVLFPRPETPRLHIDQVGQLLRRMFREEAAAL
ncbi:MAG: S24 family peptidase [Bacteroidota bacterium]